MATSVGGRWTAEPQLVTENISSVREFPRAAGRRLQHQAFDRSQRRRGENSRPHCADRIEGDASGLASAPSPGLRQTRARYSASQSVVWHESDSQRDRRALRNLLTSSPSALPR